MGLTGWPAPHGVGVDRRAVLAVTGGADKNLGLSAVPASLFRIRLQGIEMSSAEICSFFGITVE